MRPIAIKQDQEPSAATRDSRMSSVPPCPGAWTCQGDVSLNAGGGGSVCRSIHEVAGVSRKRNVLAKTTAQNEPVLNFVCEA